MTSSPQDPNQDGSPTSDPQSGPGRADSPHTGTGAEQGPADTSRYSPDHAGRTADQSGAADQAGAADPSSASRPDQQYGSDEQHSGGQQHGSQQHYSGGQFGSQPSTAQYGGQPGGQYGSQPATAQYGGGSYADSPQAGGQYGSQQPGGQYGSQPATAQYGSGPQYADSQPAGQYGSGQYGSGQYGAAPYGSGQPGGYGGPGGPGGPGYGRSGGSGFIKSLFDLRFENFIAVRWAGIIYVIAIIVAVLWWLGAIVTGIAAGAVSRPMDYYLGSEPSFTPWPLIIAILFGWIIPALWVIFVRIALELIVASVKTAEHTKKIADSVGR